VLEDNPIMSMILERRLKLEFGERLYMASTVEGAMKLYQKHKPTLVISDWNISETETASKFINFVKSSRKGKRGKAETTVVVLSADATSVVEKASKVAGADLFCPKPIDFEGLMDYVRYEIG
jgi:DNA-binding NarL/FixJ family response regulator